MIDREKLNDRQHALLKRVAEGDDLSRPESLRDRQSAYVLSNRGLITVSKRGAVFRAQLTGAGRARLQEAENKSSSPPCEPQPSPTVSATATGKRKAPDATVETAELRSKQARKLLNQLADGEDFWVESPTEQEAATWRRVVDFAKRNDLVPAGKTLERRTSGPDLIIRLVDGVHPNTKPASPQPEAPVVRVPETLRGCHPVIATLRDDERRLLMPKPQRRRSLLILQAVASEAERRGHRVKNEPVATDRYAYSNVVRDRDGAIRVEIDGHGFAVRVSQVSPNSENPERSGALLIEVPPYHVRGRQTKWPDGKRRKVEDVLDLILPELETQAAEAKQRKIDEERAKAERRTNWEKAMGRAKAAAITAYKAKILDKQVENWRRAATLREYRDALTDRIAQANRGKQQVDDAVLAWAKWITEYTAAIDPLTSIPRMPDVPELSPEDLKPFLGKWSPYGPEESSYRYGWRS